MSRLYFGLAGQTLLEYESGWSQPSGTYTGFDVETLPEYPAGESGSVHLRDITATIRYENGFHVGITPIVDGVALEEQVFQASGSGSRSLTAFLAARCNRIACRVRTITIAGVVELQNIATSVVAVRGIPT